LTFELGVAYGPETGAALLHGHKLRHFFGPLRDSAAVAERNRETPQTVLAESPRKSVCAKSGGLTVEQGSPRSRPF
jgi:hypothetical protein